MKKFIIALSFLLFFPYYSLANIWNVPGQCPTIQAGLDSCQTGDTVLVAPGTYYENLAWPYTQGICLMSESGAEFTIINGSGVNRVIKLDTGVDTTTIITGFTITNGYDQLGAGIRCINNSSPTITQNIVTQNTAYGPAYGLGGGIGVFSNSSPIIKENLITYNSADSVGGGIACTDNSNPQILNNIIKHNEADFGGGIHCYVNSNPEINGNTIDSNKAFISGGGIRSRDDCSPTITNNIISNNSADSTAGGIGCYDNSNAIITGNRIESNHVIYYGGGISCDNWSSPEIKNNTISNNIADEESGGIDCFNNSSPLIIDNLIENNTAIFAGGINCTQYCSPEIKDNNIIRNEATTSGGGILVNANSAPLIVDNIIKFNICTGLNGAGIRCGINTLQPVIKRCIIADNDGIGITCRTSSPLIDSCIIKQNSGDGLYTYQNAVPEIHNSDILENNGYGIRNVDATVTVNALTNWWGDASGPSGVGPGTGDEVSNYVAYDPWLTQPVFPDTLLVPSIYATIQEAIDAAVNGNIVLVADGTYLENINFKGKAITVASYFLFDGDTSHITNTIIDGSQPSHPDSGSVVYFISGEDTTSVLCGFTITGGTGTYIATYNDVSGGGIILWPSGGKICNNIIEYNSVYYNGGYAHGGGIMADVDSIGLVIENNIIRNNTVTGNSGATGGGISLFNPDYARIVNNTIVDNTVGCSLGAWGGGINCGYGYSDNTHILNNYIRGNKTISGLRGGGGISIYNCTPILRNNLIFENSANSGGGVLVELVTEITSQVGIIGQSTKSTLTYDKLIQDDTKFENNTIVKNSATMGGGGIRSAGCTPELMNCIVWGNTASIDPQISGNATVNYSDIEGGWSGTGNIDEDPLMVASNAYCILESTSPCVDAGHSDPIYNDVEDPNNPGYPWWPAQGTLSNDMGHFGGPSSLWQFWDWPMPIEDQSIVLSEYILMQNYPNPFNPSTTIKYGIPKRSSVELRIFDILGREVALLVNEEQDAGNYELIFDAGQLSSGVYMYQIKAGKFVETKKMLLIR